MLSYLFLVRQKFTKIYLFDFNIIEDYRYSKFLINWLKNQILNNPHMILKS